VIPAWKHFGKEVQQKNMIALTHKSTLASPGVPLIISTLIVMISFGQLLADQIDGSI
jgi:hypothetical protein